MITQLAGEAQRERESTFRRVTAPDRGSATLWGVAVMALLMAISIMITYVGVARVATHRAQTAADLSALAAARLAVEAPDRACSAASSLAAENAAVLERCTLNGPDAMVQVVIPLSLPGIPPRLIRSTARAARAEP